MRNFRLFTFVFIFLKVFSQIFGQQINVTTSRGSVFGYRVDHGNDTTQLFYGAADVFLGIPYAQPPVGNLRYAKPQNLTQFPTSPYNATFYRKRCIQPDGDMSDMSEDCLVLNIFTPNANAVTKIPVMVWIHGGGFVIGDNRIDVGGSIRNLVSRGVVVPAIQYRLGFLGFFTTQTSDFPGNLGMLDQVAGLRFIKEEISNFGGDPNQITIFGESAGSISVSAHTYSPLSRDLFNQGIMESGAILSGFEGTLGPTYRNMMFAEQACNFTQDQWHSGNFSSLKTCLMNLDVDVGRRQPAADQNRLPNAACWNMVADGEFLPDVPRNLAKQRPNKPMIIGTNRDEWAAYEVERWSPFAASNLNDYNKAYVENRIKTQYGPSYLVNQTAKAIQLYESLYVKQTIADDDHIAWLKFISDLFTCFIFTGPVVEDVVNHLLNNNHDVYVYEFTYWSPWWKPSENISGYYPVVHDSETIYVFMDEGPFLDGVRNNKTTARDLELADFFGSSWTNFAKTGKPSPTNEWLPATTITANLLEYLDVGANNTMKNGYRTVDHVQFVDIISVLLGVLPPENMPPE